MSIELPEELSAYLKGEAARRGFRDPGEFVRALIEAEQHRQMRGEVEALLLDATNGGFSEWTDDDLQDIRRVGARLIEKRKRA